MLQNIKFAAYTLSELLRKNQVRQCENAHRDIQTYLIIKVTCDKPLKSCLGSLQNLR